MRALRLLPVIFTAVFIWVLNHPMGSIPPIGRLLDPFNGCWTAAEPAHKSFTFTASIKGLRQPVSIWLEDRLVPHIRAANDHDLYLAQGYVHAYFRLWQMDLQTRAAGGRVSEVIGRKGVDFDRGQRRKGMVYAAGRSLRAMEAEPRTREMLDAYTAGINAYIQSLRYRDLPLEYKLMNFKPEPWTPLRCALLLKYMADDLTGKSDDIQYTLLRQQLGDEQFNFLFPEKIKGSKPVIPEGTKFEAPSLRQPPYPGDSVWAHFDEMQNAKCKMQKRASDNAATRANPESEIRDPESGIGSNNWAISGKHTSSGAPILCNDPHLGLNLPSLWFEVQLTAPGINVYGASLPGAPGVVIGFNDAISWGFTNNYRDVKDYYDITASGRETYLFNGRQVPFEKRVERIGIKGEPDLLDTVLYTVHGPVQYDATFPDPQKTGHTLAMTWMAHRPTNELLALYLMNRAGDYNAFTAAIQHFECPAQNFAYADKAGNIAMWGQGQFINKWRGQGRFVMEGKDSLTLWGQNIPMTENPHVLNPPQGYVASANQSVTDSTYPYWYNGDFVEWRSWEINSLINGQSGSFTAEQMQDMQQDNTSRLAGFLLYNLTQPLSYANLSPDQKSAVLELNKWNYSLGADDKTATLFQLWWSCLYQRIWGDESFSIMPSTEVTMWLLKTDTALARTYFRGALPPTQEEIDEADYDYAHALPFFDDKRTPSLESRDSLIVSSFKDAFDSLQKLKATTGLEWYKVKNTSLTHLAKIPAFSYTQLKTGGWGNTINAMKQNHGPSWRMIVEMDKSIKAYGVYPGGQSGNPGSRHYGDFIDHWVEGKYYELKLLAAATAENPFPYSWTLRP